MFGGARALVAVIQDKVLMMFVPVCVPLEGKQMTHRVTAPVFFKHVLLWCADATAVPARALLLAALLLLLLLLPPRCCAAQ